MVVSVGVPPAANVAVCVPLPKLYVLASFKLPPLAQAAAVVTFVDELYSSVTLKVPGLKPPPATKASVPVAPPLPAL